MFYTSNENIEKAYPFSEIHFLQQTKFEQERICTFVVLNIFFIFLTNLSFIIEPFTHVPYTIISYGTKAIVCVVFLTLLPIFFKKIKINFLFFLICLFLFFLLNYVVFPKLNEFQLNTFRDFMFFCLPSFIAVQYIENFYVFFKKLIMVSWLIASVSALLLLCSFGGIINVYQVGRYFMGFGYSMLIPACVCLSDYIMHRQKISVLSFLIFCVTILLMGSRGPFLSIMVMTIFILLYEMKKAFLCEQKIIISSFVKTYIGVIAILMILVFVSLFFSSITEYISPESRSLRLILSGEFVSHTSARDVIYEKALDEFFNDFISIRGLNAEYIMLKGYAHNIVVELLYQFGIVIGGGVLILILLNVIKTIVCFKNDLRSFIVIIYMICALCTLWNSHSLWVEYTFWVWIALSFNLKLNNNKEG